MKKINIALISDCIFCALCAFAVSFTVIRFYIRNNAAAVALSAVCAFSFGTISLLFMLKRRQKAIHAAAEDKTVADLMTYLALQKDKDNAQLFSKALGADSRKGNYIFCGQEVAAVLFRAEPLGANQVAMLIKGCGKTPDEIICNHVTAEAAAFAKRLGVKLTLSQGACNLLEKSGNMPEINLPKMPSAGLFSRVKLRFTRKLCPSLFFSGMALLLLSYFTFYPVYYIIFGAVLVILSVLSLLINQSS